MSKQQWLSRVIAVAGTLVLASACTGDPGGCEYIEETGEQFCNTTPPVLGPTVTLEPAQVEPDVIDDN